MVKRLRVIKASIAFILIFSLDTISLKAQEWKIDKAHSSLHFEVNHFFTPVMGVFHDFTSLLLFDPDDLENSSSNFVVRIRSVDTGNDKRDSDLKSENFFEAENYPEMTFVSSKFIKRGDAYYVLGSLTIRNVTQELEIPFKILGIGLHPIRKGKKIMSIKAEFKINRNEFGVGTGSWATTAIVGEEVMITVLIEASRNM